MIRCPALLGSATVVLLAAAPAQAQQPFQGAIATQMTGDDGTTHDASRP